MRFIVDECTGSRVARWLRSRGHGDISAFDDERGLSDEQILRRAVAEDRIVVTNDKDLGELVFRQRRQHRGVVSLRLTDQRSAAKIAALANVLERSGQTIGGRFVVANEIIVRFGREPR